MALKRLAFAALAAAALLPGAVPAHRLEAQVTTGSVGGTVLGDNGQPIVGAQVQVVNRATGFTTGAQTRDDGRFFVGGLEVGNQYAVTVRRIGYEPQTRTGVNVVLSQTSRLDFRLTSQAAVLSGVTVQATAATSNVISPTHTGITTTITDSTLRRLPSLNRNFTDFVALTPQVSTASGYGLSGGGVNNRFNNIQIDGATEADIFGLGSTGQPGGQAGGKSIAVESVKEYQVLLAPYDVRQGNFAGLLVNAVTKSGTNDLHGSAYVYTRNQNLARSEPYLTDYKQTQYGFSVGGPIVQNKAFFFVNPEFQARSSPATGVYLGQPGFTSVPAGDVQRFASLLQGYGMPNPGTAGLVNDKNPLANIFARLDFNLPHGSQLVLRHNYGHAVEDVFSRGTTGSQISFPLSSNAYQFTSNKNATVAQLRSNFSGGTFNELIAGYTTIRDARTTPGTPAPQVTAFTPTAQLIAGTERFSQANQLDQDILELTDNLTIPLNGGHKITVGTQNQFYRVRNLFAQSRLGAWTFGSLDSLQLGLPNTYIVGVPAPGTGDGAVRFRSTQYSGYLQDEWTVTDRFNLSGGVRVDVPTFNNRPPSNPDVLAQFNRNTQDIPSGNAQVSPRLGFNWDVTGDQRNQLRGGVGMFTGRPAFVWLSNAFQNSGLSGVNLLTCRGANAPQFTTAAVQNAPTACLDGTTARAGSEIDLLSKNLKFPQTLRASAGYDRDLGHGFVGTAEALYTKGVDNLFYTNIALTDPIGVDRNGRVLYGPAPNKPSLRYPGRSTVLDVTNESKDYSYDLTVGLTRRFVNNFQGSLFYTYSRQYDVQSLTSSTAFSQYRFGRTVAGNQNDLTLTPGIFDTPHHIVATGSYSFPSKTDLTLYYIGQSGAVYDYVYGGANGDLNGDGITLNDRIYVPKSAIDTNEIRFKGTPAQQAAQGAALDRYINSEPCLRDQRGRIMARNSCRAPFTHTFNLSVRQSVATLRGQNVSLVAEVFNFGNLLNSSWGQQPFVANTPAPLLVYQSQTGPSLAQGAQPIFSFDPNQQRYTTQNLASNYQIQLSVRYSF